MKEIKSYISRLESTVNGFNSKDPEETTRDLYKIGTEMGKFALVERVNADSVPTPKIMLSDEDLNKITDIIYRDDPNEKDTKIDSFNVCMLLYLTLSRLEDRLGKAYYWLQEDAKKIKASKELLETTLKDLKFLDKVFDF